MRHLLRLGFGFLAALPLITQAAAERGVYVDVRASSAANAPVVERWRLYGASHALVIGIDNYTGAWPRLSNAVQDARAVAKALEERGFEVVLLIDVTGDELRTGLRHFFAIKGADPEARLFVWYAGHGYTDSGEGYLVPADAPSPSSPEFFLGALHMGDVGSMVRIAKSKHVLAVFDSCFAGTIFQSQRARPPAAITAAVKRPVRQFLTSGDADQKVSDDGTFRTLFLRALADEERADANRDGYLTGTELSLYLENRVINLTQGVQTPRGGKLRDPRFDQGDFVFVLPWQATTQPSPAPEIAGLSEEAAYELAFWDSIKGSSQADVYEAYLAQYPEGTFAALARIKIKTLKPQDTQTTALVPPAEETDTASTLRETVPETPPLQAEVAPEPPDPAPSAPRPESEQSPSSLVEPPVPSESDTSSESPQVARLPAASEAVPESPPEAHFEVTLTKEEKRHIQRSLRDLGLYHSGIDGLFGRGTRGAIREFQEAIGIVATGYLNAAQAAKLHARAAEARADQPQSEPQQQTTALSAAPSEDEAEPRERSIQTVLTGIQLVIHLAKAGDPGAQADLGLRYLLGRDVTKDPKEALKWSLKAAKQGNAEAQSNVGFMYMTGSGTEKNEIEAARWWREAARQGLPQAQFNLGTLYENGHGVERDYEQAAEWYRLASAQGDARAWSRLERLYSRGVARPPQ